MPAQQPIVTYPVTPEPRIAKASPYPARYPWPGDPMRGGAPVGLGHAGRNDLRLALTLGRPLDFSSTREEAS